MDNKGATSAATALLLISSILIAATIVTIITSGTDESSEEDMDQILEEALDEISTYIQIKDIVGKYSSKENGQKIEQIAIMIKPLFSVEIDLSQLLIKLDNGNQVKILYYNQNADFIGAQNLFSHSIWSSLNATNFSLIVTNDNDNSIIDFNTINENTDMIYLIIKLPDDFKLKKGDQLLITLFPSTGITKIINIEAPLPIKQVVSLL